MTCKCKTEVEQKVLERWKEETPDAKNHHLEMSGYSFIFGKKVEMRGYFLIKGTHEVPMKNGSYKPKKYETRMIFTFCPFCGERYAPVEPEENAEDVTA